MVFCRNTTLREVSIMQHQYNVRVEHLSPEELAEMDQLFTNTGWVIRGFNDTIGSHSFRIYQWEQDEVDVVYPEGYGSSAEPIDLDQKVRPL